MRLSSAMWLRHEGGVVANLGLSVRIGSLALARP
jgi:hypothetical protein